MRELDPDTLMFFDNHQDALKLYQAFEDLLYNSFPNVSIPIICAIPGRHYRMRHAENKHSVFLHQVMDLLHQPGEVLHIVKN